MRNKKDSFSMMEYVLFGVAALAVFFLCVCVGSVNISLRETVTAMVHTIFNTSAQGGVSESVIMFVRFPRVICAALEGAALALCGAAMQGLLQNPLADGTTVGVSSGASLGAVLAIALGTDSVIVSGIGTTVMAMIFAFLSLLIILTLAYKLDFSLATYTIILIGVIFSMFANSIISFITTFAGDHVKTIVFWTMGSMAGSSYGNALLLLAALGLFGTMILIHGQELNAFAVGEANARHIGVDVKKIKFTILIAVSGLIGVSVSIAGTIGFVGLVIPHITRMLVGPNHKRLLPASMISGAIFLMLADLISRIALSPLVLPIGVITSFVGSIVFVYIFYVTRRGR